MIYKGRSDLLFFLAFYDIESSAYKYLNKHKMFVIA